MIEYNPQRVEAFIEAFMELHRQEYEREQEDDPQVILLSKFFENGRLNDSIFGWEPELYYRAYYLHCKSTSQNIKENK
jgi:hypothetical protein